jgi:preprotein translocase subunit SecF
LIEGNQQSEREVVMESVAEKLGPLDVLVFDFVSPLIAAEIVRHSMLAVAAACVGILLYLSWAFRRMPHPWRYGVCAVTALVHDVLLVVGAFSLLGRWLPIEIDAMFITAILTSIGFSVHDTIVVFDRLRENSTRLPDEPFDSIVNHSLMQTLVRSIGTSITTLLVLFALFLFGGTTIRPFVLALLIGITAGTYSSIFNASLLLVSWEKGESWRFLIPRRA